MSLDRWRMLRADSLIALRDLPDASVDALITDPPYSSGGAFRGDRQAASSAKYVGSDAEYPEIVGDNRDQRAYLAWSALWLAECLRVAREGAFVALFTDWRQLPTTTDALQAGGWCWRGIASWAKPIGSFRSHAGRPGQACEFVVWGSKGAMPIRTGDPSRPGWWLESSPREREHMTEKPIGVMRDLAKLCVPDGTILDPFAGAATTGVAALMEGRRFIGIETSAEYFAIADRRLREVEMGVDRGALTRGQAGLFAAVSP